MYSTLKDHDNSRMIRDGKYEIPMFSSVFAYYANRFDKDKALVNQWIDWMFRFSLLPQNYCERRVREASDMTTTYMFPFCKNIHRYERLLKWIVYLFICDDNVETKYGEFGRNKQATRPMLDQTMQCIKRLEGIYVNGEPENHISMMGFKPYVICTYFVVEEILLGLNSVQRKRFLNTWKSYCVANDKENELIEQQILDFDVIKKVRLESGAMKTVFALIEYSENIYISEHIWQDNRIQRLLDLCNLCTVFVNDVYSFEKEYLEQNEDITKMIVTIVGFHVLKDKSSIEEAFAKSIDIIKEYEFEYKELADSLINDKSISADTKKFIKCLTAINGGNFALSIHADRYNYIYKNIDIKDNYFHYNTE